MARIRTIKPDFFKNEQVSELPAMNRLLFIGLWTQADREGKLEDRPKRLKVEIFPYDDFDVSLALDQLQTNGLLVRYEIIDNETTHKFIKILTFERHQQPNIKEAKSVIPEPENIKTLLKHHASIVLASQERKGTGKEQERKGREGEKKSDAFSRPTFDDIYNFFVFKINETFWDLDKCKFQAKKFIDHYDSNGWHVGKNKMSRWKSAASGWINRDNEFSQNKKNNQNGKETTGSITAIINAGMSAREKAIANLNPDGSFR